jgi:cell division protein FtsL
MTRVLSILGVVLLMASSFGLYKLKYQVQRLDRQAQALEKSIQHEKRTIRVLDAEWTYLNQPQRIQDLATRFLHLQPLQTSQIGTIDDIPLQGAQPGAAQPRVAVRTAPPRSSRQASRQAAATLAAVQTLESGGDE